MLRAVANGRFPRVPKLVADSESATPPPDLAIRREHKFLSSPEGAKQSQKRRGTNSLISGGEKAWLITMQIDSPIWLLG
jgi:hypothetical protein